MREHPDYVFCASVRHFYVYNLISETERTKLAHSKGSLGVTAITSEAEQCSVP